MLAGSRYFDEDENKTAGLRPVRPISTRHMPDFLPARTRIRLDQDPAGVRPTRRCPFGKDAFANAHGVPVLIHRTSLARAWHCGEPLHRRLAYGSWRNHAECTLRGAKCTRWGLIRRRPDRENSTTRRRRTVMRRRTLPPCLRVPSPCRPTGVRDRIPLPRRSDSRRLHIIRSIPFISSRRGTWDVVMCRLDREPERVSGDLTDSSEGSDCHPAGRGRCPTG